MQQSTHLAAAVLSCIFDSMIDQDVTVCHKRPPCKHRSRYDVARHLGVMVERRPGRREPEDVDMADEDVAALLMSLPMDTG